VLKIFWYDGCGLCKRGDRGAMIDTAVQTSFESDRGFRDAFSKIFSDTPAHIPHQTTLLMAKWIDTVLGPMVAIADDEALYLLEFMTRRGLAREIERLRKRGFAIIPGESRPLQWIESELASYFDGKLTQFKTPYRVFGSEFQQQVWNALCQIHFGETRSYRDQARSLNKPTAYRAVANANGANQLAIIIPCHRIINSDGTLGGYGGGTVIKQWLLEHEQRYRL
jgi:AraC family transcriptional regulator, regulatory protein of adaptative response / methylated-DNA-[protein]-cysteine methyltransferase